MKITKNVEAPAKVRTRKGKYKELWEALKEMPVDSWIKVRFDEKIVARHKSAVYTSPANTFDVRMSIYVIDEYTMKVGKLSIEEKS